MLPREILTAKITKRVIAPVIRDNSIIMKQFSMLGILFLLSTGLFAQVSIRGKVLDAKTDEPIPYGKITSSLEQVLTSNNGEFDIRAMNGDQLEISAIGYRVETRIISGTASDLTIRMFESSVTLPTMEVFALRADDKTPVARTDMDEEAIESQDVARDMPYILENTPSVVTTSDAGAGIGYTGLRIRGSDQSRINVTINGVPVNDAESQGVFWVNTPDLASSLSSLQIQRGVGTSTNGAGAFGASINMETKSLTKESYASVHLGGGSFNTQRYTLNFGTGLINGHWTLDGRATRIKSDGWIDRASSDLRSYYLALGYTTGRTTVKAVVFGGRERTYQAWYGTDSATFAADRRFNYAGAIYDANWNVTDYYDDQVDNYGQDYYQLHINHQLNTNWSLGVSGFYTRGAGYYQEYQQDQAFGDYGLTPIYSPTDTIAFTDLTRRLWLDNHYYGALANVTGSIGDLQLTIGGAWNRYDGDHYGTILWARYASDSEPRDRFYDNNSIKNDVNGYVKAEYALNEKWIAYADLQVRNVAYNGGGTEEENFNFQFEDNLTFFNPKAGVVYTPNAHSRWYASYAVANREPNRKDYLNAVGGDMPRPERLQDVEIGFDYGKEQYAFSVNGYFMYYTDQLVLTGELDNVGYPIRENVGESYRAGIEISGIQHFGSLFSLSENITFSGNQNINYVESLGDTATMNLGSTPIAYSPSVIAGVTGTFHLPLNLDFSITGRTVSEQHLTNNGNDNLVLPAYTVADLRLSGQWEFTSLKSLRAYVLAANITSNRISESYYASNGYVYGNSVWFYPQAPINFFFGLEFGF